ncbi:MAG TPA: phosphoribosylglycinamide formyltransferase [Kiritimatiellia bacterium]|nr:phosphoribosylglycinamide formyltransferase [Kiritimatiellia bacterium]HMO98260.1 phosphoribosylglycinamide formyltransferase [Kiritimatiellia bacterium]HMP96605.1 phosphoribosylglycinamide formyltransferase [Kiritimatiellia bacterium]
MNAPPVITLGILGSGGGSNYQALAEAIAGGSLAARIGCVISDVPDAFILERAASWGHSACAVDMAPFKTKMDGPAEERVIHMLREHRVDVVCLAGFMRMVKPGLLAAFPGRVINIHPSLLPAFPGLRAWEQALRHGVKVSGCTVHLVDEGMDTGPILVQRAVPVLPDDTPESLHARIQEQERIAYPEAIRLVIARLAGNHPPS